ncbi:MAG: Asp-tRNA(Asn)/Glu-tRNA(Gln) amidotransferase subunit GatB [Ruminococcus sp.]|jgi:aspartyl-tRNA(Asn)/glutamyl-tRNA(Gln) amidotransferase subunit B|nr:Asp-tRNA(Asn)/Glu-tRNA(Gln) amidotransferase subunit GatB [Ruminococcus sp.]
MAGYIPVIGLEIHAELLTQSKVFCTCSASFGGTPNSRCCPVCSGFPGTLPVINQTAVEYAIKAGFALNCGINQFSVFDRKNYFYPDLPKAYQISQLNLPLCINGLVPVEYTENGEKKTHDIRINRIHLEEDAGKLTHNDLDGVSFADYNRCGIPLIEIVTEPDIGSAEEAKAFVEKVSLLLQYAGVCDCKMEQGSLRCDVNISIMKPTDTELGTRAEIKNLNSVKAIGRAIEFEIYRQSKLLDMGGRVVQETRRFDDNKGETKSMRSKENANDYRYFPEPDILQVNISDEQLSEIKAKMPEMPDKRLERYLADYAISETDALIIINNKIIADFYDEAVRTYNNPKAVCNFITGEMMRRINIGEIDINEITFTPEQLAKIVMMAETDVINKSNAKDVFRALVENPCDPEKIAADMGFVISNDSGKMIEVIEQVMSDNPKAVEQYKNGETKVFGFLMGQCSKALKGIATSKAIKDELEKRLSR